MASSKGKEIIWEESYGKRKRDDKDKFGDNAKRKNRGVLQFFDDAACEVDDDEDSDEDDFLKDFLEDEFQGKDNVFSEPGKASHTPVLPKEEEISEEEFDRMLEERYKPGSGLVTYAEDAYESSSLNQGNTFMLSTDPTIWKVKCMVGRERSSAFCLMQKYVDLHSLGTKLQIISACALDHVKGFIYIEAEKQVDLNEACKGICTIYPSRVAPVSKNEVSHLFTVRSKNNEISVGTWARVKNGKYRGDLAQVMAVDEARKKATVKLIPRVDLQALAEKYGGGISLRKKTANPAPKLISSTELEEFRPLIQYRRDRDIGQTFEVLDGLMLKDGYLFKKVPIDSLNFWGVMPSEDELLKFEPSSTVEEPDCQEFLTELYGEPKKKPSIKSNKGGGKGESSSSSGPSNSFEVHDLVLFNKKEFGVVVGSEKDDYFKVLKEGSEGPVAVTVEQRQLKNASFDKKLTALDHRKKTVSVNDTVRVLEGPLQGREGIVKQVYRGIVFLCDEREQENSGYVCCKSQICEKVKLSDGACKGKGDESGAADFGDPMSSPKSPLSPKKPWQMRENNNKFNREGKDGMFSVGQSLRIRVGPLKGYLCRVLAVRRSDITVKLDSQHKILTVKQEHLSEVRGKSSAVSIGNDGESAKPFDFLGTQDSSGDWMAGAGASADGERSGAAERTPWPTFSSSAFSRQPGSSSAQAGNSNDANKDAGDAAWDSKMTSNQNTTSWGAAAGSSEQAGGWGKSEDTQKKPVADTGASDSWGKAVAEPKQTGGWGSAGRSSDQPTAEGSGWKKASTEEGSQSKTWGNVGNDGGTTGTATGGSNWGKPDSGTSWNKQGAGSSRDNQAGGSSWGKPAGGSTWAKPTANAGSSDAAASTWGRIDNGSSEQSGGWKKSVESFDKSKNDDENGGSTWGKAAETVKKGIEGSSQNSWGSPAKKWGNTDAPGNSKPSWNASSAEPKNQAGGWGNAGKNLEQPDAGGSGWKKASNEDGGQTKSWGNTRKDAEETGGATSWGKQDSGTWNKQAAGSSLDNQAGGSSWGKPAGGSSWAKPTDASPGSEPDKNDSWAKAAEKSTKDDTGGKKAAWNSSSSGAEAKTGGWGNGGGSGNQDGGSSWKSPAGGSSWNKQQTDGSAGGDSWGKPSGGGRGGWNQNKMGNKDDEDQQGWDSGKSFDGGRGSGGRRGRGGREQFGRGSFGRGQSSDWNKDDQGFGGGSRPSWGKPDNSEDKDNGGGGSWGSGAQKWGSGDGSGGGFGGRGGYGGRGDRGGFGGRGDRGGFGGRGDRGGFQGRGDRGGFQGRGDRGGFRGRGDFGGRGRGRRDQNDGDWNSRNDSGEGWKSSNGGGSWGNDGGNKGGSWGNDGGNKAESGSSGWKASTGGGAGNTWGKSNEGDGGSGGWKQSNTADGGQSSGGWNQPKGAAAKTWGNAPSSSWGKSNDGGAAAGGTSGGWKQGNSADGSQSSGGWNKPKGSSDTANTWGKPPSSTWGKNNEGGGGGSGSSADGGQSSGGWNKPNGGSNGANTGGSAPSSTWGKSNEGGGSGGASGGWKQSNPASGGQSSGGWNQPKETPAAANNAWGKSSEGGGTGGGSILGTWKQSNPAGGGQSSGGWNQPAKETSAAANTSSWGKSSEGGGQSSGWNQSKELPVENAGGEAVAADPWGKASSWGKGNGGGSSSGGGKGGW